MKPAVTISTRPGSKEGESGLMNALWSLAEYLRSMLPDCSGGEPDRLVDDRESCTGPSRRAASAVIGAMVEPAGLRMPQRLGKDHTPSDLYDQSGHE